VHQENFTILPRPRVVISISQDTTEVERKAVEDAVTSAGAREVFLVEKSMATAIGGLGVSAAITATTGDAVASTSNSRRIRANNPTVVNASSTYMNLYSAPAANGSVILTPVS